MLDGEWKLPAEDFLLALPCRINFEILQKAAVLQTPLGEATRSAKIRRVPPLPPPIVITFVKKRTSWWETGFQLSGVRSRGVDRQACMASYKPVISSPTAFAQMKWSLCFGRWQQEVLTFGNTFFLFVGLLVCFVWAGTEGWCRK